MHVKIDKYYCDLCEKEVKPRDLYDIRMDSTEACLFRKEVCLNCYLDIRNYALDLLKKSKRIEKDSK